MTEDYKKIAESIRSGKYFGDARDWFEAVYIGPVSERSFFLIIACLAGLIALFGFISVSRLMPITKREPILIHASERMDEVQPTLVPLAPHHAAANPGITQFFVASYVQLRESFDSRTFQANARFIHAQSDDATYNAYVRAYNPSNVQSPFAPLGEIGQRQVVISSIEPVKVKSKDNPAGHEFAQVVFSTETRGIAEPVKSVWTANIEYIYTGLDSKMVKDPETHKKELEVTDPHFQVVNYVLTQNQ